MGFVFLDFVREIVTGDIDHVSRRLADSPALATTSSDVGATRHEASTFFFSEALTRYLFSSLDSRGGTSCLSEPEDKAAKMRRAVRANNFTQQTNALDVDKHM